MSSMTHCIRRESCRPRKGDICESDSSHIVAKPLVLCSHWATTKNKNSAFCQMTVSLSLSKLPCSCYTYRRLVAGSLHGVLVKHSASDASISTDDEVNDDTDARVPRADTRVRRRPFAALLHRPLAELTLGVLLGLGHVDDAARGCRVGAGQHVLAHDDCTAGRQGADGQYAHGADDTAQGTVSTSLLCRCMRPEVVQRRHRLIHLHRRNHDDGWLKRSNVALKTNRETAASRMNRPRRLLFCTTLALPAPADIGHRRTLNNCQFISYFQMVKTLNNDQVFKKTYTVRHQSFISSSFCHARSLYSMSLISVLAFEAIQLLNKQTDKRTNKQTNKHPGRLSHILHLRRS